MPHFNLLDLTHLYGLNPRWQHFPEEFQGSGLHLSGPMLSYAVSEFGPAVWADATLRALGNVDQYNGELATRLNEDVNRLKWRRYAAALGVDVGLTLPDSLSARPADEEVVGAAEFWGQERCIQIREHAGLLRGQRWQTVWGCVVNVVDNQNAGDAGGVIAVRVCLCPQAPPGGKRFWLVPWSRFQPDTPTWEAYVESADNVVAWLEASGLFSEQNSIAIDLVRKYDDIKEEKLVAELPWLLEFEGESLGLPIAMSAVALARGRIVSAWATGRINHNLAIANVQHVGRKVRHFCDFLNASSSQAELPDIARRDLAILVPCGVPLVNEAQQALAGGRMNLPVNRPCLADGPAYWESLPDLLEHFHLFSDPFVLRAETASGGLEEHLAAQDSTVFFDHLDRVAQTIAYDWLHSRNGEHYNEILLCTPFHADAADAVSVLTHAANCLAAEFGKLRRDRGQEFSTLPAPMVWDLERVAPENLMEEKSIERLIEDNSALYEGIGVNDVRVAMGRKHRLVFLVIDTGRERSCLRQRHCGKEDDQRLRKAFAKVRPSDRGEQLLTPQRVVFVFPDRHVQLFAEECLKDLVTTAAPDEPPFRQERFPCRQFGNT